MLNRFADNLLPVRAWRTTDHPVSGFRAGSFFLLVCGECLTRATHSVRSKGQVLKVFKGYCIALLTLVISTTVVADELPQGPLLQRFGETINELPKPASPPEAKLVPRELHIEGQEALNHPGTPSRPGPETTGNPSIDNMQARDRDACRRVQSAALGKGKGLSLGCE